MTYIISIIIAGAIIYFLLRILWEMLRTMIEVACGIIAFYTLGFLALLAFALLLML